jgi:hypothetical protein
VSRSAVRDAILHYRVDPALPREDAAARISAYVYGNILIFAAMLALDEADIRHGHAVIIELGVAVSTFLAHVLSEVIGRSVRTGTPTTRADVLHEVRDSLPVATSALVPCLLLTAAALHWLPATAAVIASEVYLFARLALVGLIIERLHTDRAPARTALTGLMVALLALGIAVLKVAFKH